MSWGQYEFHEKNFYQSTSEVLFQEGVWKVPSSVFDDELKSYGFSNWVSFTCVSKVWGSGILWVVSDVQFEVWNSGFWV